MSSPVATFRNGDGHGGLRSLARLFIGESPPPELQRMSGRRLAVGREGEDLVAARLVARGWTIVARNWRSRLGEVDIVARDGACLVIVEVRTRVGRRLGTPEESVGPAKRARLARLAVAYCQHVGWQGPCRIDVVAVELGATGEPTRVAHHRSSVSGEWYRP